MKTAFNKLLIEKYQKINNNQLEMFYKYMQLLLEWNKKINLTAITDENEIILKHFVDSLTVLKYINEKDNIIDVGTGAGFPGIPIAIMMPNVKITLLDSLNKRINYLNEIIKELNLKDIETVCSRSEDYTKIHREEYDIVVSRAVAQLRILSEITFASVKTNGFLIAMKGNIDKELEESLDIIDKLNGKVVEINKFNLPKEESVRNIIKIEKINKTPNIYPREYSKIKKEVNKK